jgi:hypothetical protein
MEVFKVSIVYPPRLGFQASDWRHSWLEGAFQPVKSSRTSRQLFVGLTCWDRCPLESTFRLASLGAGHA